EHSGRRIRFLLRNASPLPVPKRRKPAGTQAQHRLPLCHRLLRRGANDRRSSLAHRRTTGAARGGVGMRANGMLELDSYRLAAYTVPSPCYICGGGNNYDAELCRHCHAPMALAHQAMTQKIHPRMIAAIGPSGAGKTVYLGMLSDMLSRQDEQLQLLARGAFSIRLQQSAMASLARCEFPRKTPHEPDRWNCVHCQVLRKKQKPAELIMPDLAGEALLEEVDHPGTYPVIRSFLGKCAGVLVLVDAPRAQSGESDEDFHTMKLVSYLSELAPDRQTGWAA